MIDSKSKVLLTNAQITFDWRGNWLITAPTWFPANCVPTGRTHLMGLQLCRGRRFPVFGCTNVFLPLSAYFMNTSTRNGRNVIFVWPPEQSSPHEKVPSFSLMAHPKAPRSSLFSPLSCLLLSWPLRISHARPPTGSLPSRAITIPQPICWPAARSTSRSAILSRKLLTLIRNYSQYPAATVRRCASTQLGFLTTIPI